MSNMNTNTKIDRHDAWIIALENIADQMEDGGNVVLPAHLDSVIAELEFEKTQIMLGNGEAIVQKN